MDGVTEGLMADSQEDFSVVFLAVVWAVAGVAEVVGAVEALAAEGSADLAAEVLVAEAQAEVGNEIKRSKKQHKILLIKNTPDLLPGVFFIRRISIVLQ